MDNPTGKRVKLKIDGEKFRGTVTAAQTETQEIDVTQGGLYGGEPDIFRRAIPGRKRTILTIVLEG